VQRSVSAALVAALLTACSAPRGEPVGTSSSAIISGVPSPTSQNYVVEIIHPVAGGAAECSGTLVAPNLVLTARHCVSVTPDVGFTCDSSGSGSDGGAVVSDYDPSTLYIYTGTAEATGTETAATTGVRLFHDDATNICNHDLALIELATPLTSLPIATLDLNTELEAGQNVTAVGYGLTADGTLPTVRLERTGIPIVSIGPSSDSEGYNVAPNDFDLGESICSGDSGGPALDAVGAVVGVASSGGNGTTSDNPAQSCIGSGTINLYSETSAFRDVILDAFTAVGATPVLTAVPLGASCTSDGECSTGLCAGVSSDAGTTCTADCASAACPSGSTCVVHGGESLCTPSASGGCRVASDEPESGGYWGVALAGGILLVVRRRRLQRGVRDRGECRGRPTRSRLGADSCAVAKRTRAGAGMSLLT
jgi:MYXO-CTERM domain-containing protein